MCSMSAAKAPSRHLLRLRMLRIWICVNTAPFLSVLDESILTVDECGRVIGKRKGVASVTVAVTYKGVTKSAVVPFAVR